MGGVQYTLDTAVAALLTNPNRKFTYSDMVGLEELTFYYTMKIWTHYNLLPADILRQVPTVLLSDGVAVDEFWCNRRSS